MSVESESRMIAELNRRYTFFSWAVQSAVKPLAVVGAKGCYFWDADGKRYLDFSSQLMNVNTGHQHPKGGSRNQGASGAALLCLPWSGHRSSWRTGQTAG